MIWITTTTDLRQKRSWSRDSFWKKKTNLRGFRGKLCFLRNRERLTISPSTKFASLHFFIDSLPSASITCSQAMKLATIILYFFAASASADEIPSQIVGRGRRLANDEAESAATIAQLVLGARNIHPISGRRLESPHDKLDVLIKNIDCSACMEAPPASLIPGRKLLRADAARELGHHDNDVFVTALNCDANDPYQIWNLLSLEATGTWYLFESAETGECMQLVGVCNPDGTLYDIEMGPCDSSNFKAFWAFTGIGEIVNFECFRSNWESETFFHSTPDVFLEAKCSNRGGIDYLDISSHSHDSMDQAENAWVLYPKTFGSIAPP